jgi:futalosine hydrolase
MPSVLVVIPSEKEYSFLYPECEVPGLGVAQTTDERRYDVAICGVGLLNFSVNLSVLLAHYRYECAFLLGVCGAYPHRGLGVGDVVRVKSEIVGDMGVQEQDGSFTPWSSLSKSASVGYGENGGTLPESLRDLPSVSGLTVNCCTGTSKLAFDRSARFNVDVESMEGAALFAVCNRFGVPCFEFRAVSNIATDRDPSAWRIPEALAALKREVLDKL